MRMRAFKTRNGTSKFSLIRMRKQYSEAISMNPFRSERKDLLLKVQYTVNSYNTESVALHLRHLMKILCPDTWSIEAE